MNRVETTKKPPFIVLREPAVASPVVVDVPHAGEVIPEEVAPTIGLPAERLRGDVDLYVDRLCEWAPSAGATLMATTISRFVVDLNRYPDDLPPEALGRRIRRPPVSYGSRGLIWTETTSGDPVFDRHLTDEELSERLRYYRAYHELLGRILRARHGQFGSAILVDVHSMPSRGKKGHSDAGVERPDIILGDNLGKACEAFVIDAVEDELRRAGYAVVRNQPYRGGYITQHYGRPRKGVQALQIEVSRKLYMDERTFAYQPQRAEAVKNTLRNVVKALVRLGLSHPI